MKKTFSVYPQNLAYYNEGYIVGGWIELPQKPEVIKKFLDEVVKIDNQREEYEIADIEYYPFEYEGVQWASLESVNRLALFYSELDEFQKEAVEVYVEENCITGIDEIINVCLQADEISYHGYSFEGAEHLTWVTNEKKIAYKLLEGRGIKEKLEEMGMIDYIDVEKYGRENSFDYTLHDNGYLDCQSDSIDLKLYSRQEIREIAQEKCEKEKELEIEL